MPGTHKHSYVLSKAPECNGYYKVDPPKGREAPATIHVGFGEDFITRDRIYFGASIETKTSWNMDNMDSDDDSYHGPWPLNGNFDGEDGTGKLTYDALMNRYYRVKGKPGKEFEVVAWTPRRDCRMVFAAKASKTSHDGSSLPVEFGVRFVSAEVVLGDKASCERFMTELENSMD